MMFSAILSDAYSDCKPGINIKYRSDGKLFNTWRLQAVTKGRDLTELQRHTFGNSVDRYTLKKLLQRLFPACRCRQVLQQRQSAAQQVS
ncbi:hypothetical protein ACOMHN_006392 [Nucella lapillus]